VWTITLRDLQYRRRQFGIAVLGAALVFALALVLTGVSQGFRTEVEDTVGAIGADWWVVPKGVTGPFTSQSALPVDLTGELPGEAHPILTFGHVARLPDGTTTNVNVIGHSIGALGDPVWGRGEAAPSPGQAVVDDHLDVKKGDTVTIASRRIRVARVVSGRTYFAGVPVVYMSESDAQQLGFDGRPLANSIVVRGAKPKVPPGYSVLSNADVRKDLLNPIKGATQALDVMRILMWIVAAVIIGAVTYLSALERVRDFAVLKAVGGSSRALVMSLGAQSVLAALLAALAAMVLAQGLAPMFPLPVTITTTAYLLLPAIAIVVGLLSSLAALRRAIAVDPALAFSG
jgi:putative ABC transport system permease protein